MQQAKKMTSGNLTIAYLKELSQVAISGDIDINLGKKLLLNNEWGLSIQYLLKGLGKGSVSDIGEANMVLGQAYLKQGSLALSGRHFEIASEHGYLSEE